MPEKKTLTIVADFQNNGRTTCEYTETIQELMETYCVSDEFADKTKNNRVRFIALIREIEHLVKDVNTVQITSPPHLINSISI